MSKRTVLIIWSWNASGLGEGQWRLSGQQPTEDHVLCQDWPASPEALSKLQATIDAHTSLPEQEMMVFLHRHHGYVPDMLPQLLIDPQAQLLNQRGSCQVFLFGEGADAIYLNTDPRGLLGASGSFTMHYEEAGEQRQRTAIANEQERLLKVSHFNHIWSLYRHALRRRIFELQEDLWRSFSQLSAAPVLESGSAYQWLSRPQERLLLLRLLSFAGRLRPGSRMGKELRTFERNQQQNFAFDDCVLQLQSAGGTAARELHSILADEILQNVLAKGDSIDLVRLRQRFDQLLENIPGLTYHS